MPTLGFVCGKMTASPACGKNKEHGQRARVINMPTESPFLGKQEILGKLWPQLVFWYLICQTELQMLSVQESLGKWLLISVSSCVDWMTLEPKPGVVRINTIKLVDLPATELTSISAQACAFQECPHLFQTILRQPFLQTYLDLTSHACHVPLSHYLFSVGIVAIKSCRWRKRIASVCWGTEL